jgi:hypothetical protein
LSGSALGIDSIARICTGAQFGDRPFPSLPS